MSTIWHRIRLGAVLGMAAFALGCASAPKQSAFKAPPTPTDGVTMHSEYHDAPIGSDSLRSYIEAQ